MNRNLYRKVSQTLLNMLVSQGIPSREELPPVFAALVMHSGARKLGVPLPDWHWKPSMPDTLPTALFDRAMDLLDAVPAEDWSRRPELAGWLYQYMLEERKDALFASFKKGGKAEPSDIPAVTQLFTPDWIARFMAENAIGRLALESGRIHRALPSWTCYDGGVGDGAQASPEFHTAFQQEPPGEWRILDPACGCGHVLSAAFDVLLDIGQAAGVPASVAVRRILVRSLHGLDIDPVAVMLCRFVLLMKAASVDPSVVYEEIYLQIHVLDGEGRETGSLLKTVEPADGAGWGVLAAAGFDAVLTNPPYLGRRHMSPALAAYLDREYPRSRHDLFASFLERALELLRPGGYHAVINQQAWMYLAAYEDLRRHMLEEAAIVTVLHLGARAFRDINGEVVQSVCAVLRKGKPPDDAEGTYWRLTGEHSPSAKEAAYALRRPQDRFRIPQAVFKSIPGCRVAYDLPPEWAEVLRKMTPLSRFYAVKKGMDTGNNSRYVRYWHEIPPALRRIGGPALDPGRFGNPGQSEPLEHSEQPEWLPYAKGGGSRRWYGNHYYMVEWSGNGSRIRRDPRSNLRNEAYYGRPGITWSTVSTGRPGFRMLPAGFLFDNGGSCLFPLGDNTDLYATLAYLNSGWAVELLAQMNPTLNVQPGDVGRLPADAGLLAHPELSALGRACVETAKADWEESERAWEFRIHPIVRLADGRLPLREAYAAWVEERSNRLTRLSELEDRIDRLVYDYFGIRTQGHSRYEAVPSSQDKGELRMDLCSILSYAAGRMLEQPGESPDHLNAADSQPPLLELTPAVLMRQFNSWLDSFGGEDNREANLAWLAEALGCRIKESPGERLFRYYGEEWEKEHTRLYGGKPLYARLCSGEERAYLAFAPVLELNHRLVARVLEALERKQTTACRGLDDGALTKEQATELEAYRRRLKAFLTRDSQEPPSDLCARARADRYAVLWEEPSDRQPVS